MQLYNVIPARSGIMPTVRTFPLLSTPYLPVLKASPGCLECGSPNYSSGHNELHPLPASNQFSLLECSDSGDDLDYHLSTTQNAPAQASPDQDQDSLLVKRRNDNHSPGPVIRELVPSSHQRSELSNTILCIFSG